MPTDIFGIFSWRGRGQKATLLPPHDNRCEYCGCVCLALTKDHITPKSRGGSGGWHNIAWACEPCNGAKADWLLSEWPIPYAGRVHRILAACMRSGSGENGAWLEINNRRLPIGRRSFDELVRRFHADLETGVGDYVLITSDRTYPNAPLAPTTQQTRKEHARVSREQHDEIMQHMAEMRRLRGVA